MRPWRVTIALAVAATLGCGANRHHVLAFFFDGVPAPRPAPAARVAGAPAASSATPTRFEHGPYAAKLCASCHAAVQGNALVAHNGDLCFGCHELRLDKAYIHGPLGTGGCLVCHDPHSSPSRNLLVSETTDFCFHCHERARVEPHAAGERCLTCHDAHQSDRPHLLR